MDATSYWGRLRHMMDICGPPSWKTLFATDAELDKAKNLCHAVRTSSTFARSGNPTDEVKNAQALCAAALHPDTQQPIPLAFRMAAHVPVNSVLLWAMLSAPTPVTVAAAQLANQGFNAAQFFANRNASNSVSTGTVIASFIGAVSSAVAVGYGLSRWAESSCSKAISEGRSAAFPRHLRILTPFVAASAAKPLQIGLMRGDEWREGVAVYDSEGTLRGRSVAAGRWAVGATVACRTLYLFPMLYLPYLHSALEARWLPTAVSAPASSSASAAGQGTSAGVARPAAGLLSSLAPGPARIASTVLYIALAGLSSAYATPACMAIFEQRSSLPVSSLEGDFAGLADSAGRPVERLYFNKGL